MRALFATLALAAGCMQPDFATCPGDLICPMGLVCDPAHQGCTTQGQLDACRGLTDETPCMARGVVDGVCHEGVCLPGGCGNGRIDPGEACDDGNHAAHDGCSPDCTSNETCGNGVVDADQGEECDDGNFLDHDGCDSTCRAEHARWSVLSFASPFVEGSAVAYDEARGRVVVFGGTDTSGTVVTGSTYEWDGAAWLQITPPISPAPRTGAAMAYDPDRHVVVMFGGFDLVSTLFGDTWTWDGEQWTEIVSDTAPAPRQVAAMAYDPIIHRMVLFGGVATYANNETWEWDGVTWTQVVPAAQQPSPPALNHVAMAFDPVQGKVVLAASDTWVYDQHAWTKQLDSQPGLMPNPTMAFDRALGSLVLVGDNQHCFVWTGNAWQPVTIVGNTTASRIAFDAHAGQTFLFSGSSVLALAPSPLGWSTVTQLYSSPYYRAFPTATYDRARGRFVMFGGGLFTTYYGELWEFDGSRWQVHTATEPQGATYVELASDTTGHTLMVGGTLPAGNTETSTWSWDGLAWTEYPNTNPNQIHDAALAFDVKHGQFVRFGGQDQLGALNNDTSIWDGSKWLTVTPDVSPSARWYHAMAYDERRERIVLFGGTTAAAGDDTWEWDGTNWQQVTTVMTKPPARSFHRMTYDPRRGEIVLFGGTTVDQATVSDAWEYNGSDWHRIAAAPPPGVDSPAFAYDTVDGAMLAFGFGGSLDLWRLQWEGGRDEACDSGLDLDGDGLVGCKDPDCYGQCDPVCSPQTTPQDACWMTGPSCGDGVCSALESCELCPGDCGACAPSCGDDRCDPGEATTCPGDCPPP